MQEEHAHLVNASFRPVAEVIFRGIPQSTGGLAEVVDPRDGGRGQRRAPGLHAVDPSLIDLEQPKVDKLPLLQRHVAIVLSVKHHQFRQDRLRNVVLPGTNEPVGVFIVAQLRIEETTVSNTVLR